MRLSCCRPLVTLPSLLVLGTDVVLAAAPATQIQLAHACLAAGYRPIIPSSWGDELIAARVMERVGRTDTPIVQCSCPLVANRLAAHGDAIEPMTFFAVAPPVAAASYLRALYAPKVLRITFAGGCPSGSHPSIDDWISVAQLFAQFAEHGIDVSQQPTEFDSVLPPDRRRFYSDPGGIPTQLALDQLSRPVELVELTARDFAVELAQHLLSPSRTLIDVAPALGCACSGAVTADGARLARARVRDMEPPRALSPVVDHAVPVAIEGVSSNALAAPALPVDLTAPAGHAVVPGGSAPQSVATTVEASPRRSPSGPSRAVLGTMPQSRRAGRQLPRAYVARRRSSPKGMRASAVRRQLADGASEERVRWLLIGGAGVALGLTLAWLLGLVV